MATRTEKNQERLKLIDPSIRGAVSNVLRGMEVDSHEPVIASDVWRSPARQLELYNLGRSQLKWGFHNATRPDGSPGSLAADIVCFHDGWNVTLNWWLHLGYHAWQNGLDWGGYFGLEDPMRDTLRTALERMNFTAPIKLGWDPAHIQTPFVTVAEAREGKR